MPCLSIQVKGYYTVFSMQVLLLMAAHRDQRWELLAAYLHLCGEALVLTNARDWFGIETPGLKRRWDVEKGKKSQNDKIWKRCFALIRIAYNPPFRAWKFWFFFHKWWKTLPFKGLAMNNWGLSFLHHNWHNSEWDQVLSSLNNYFSLFLLLFKENEGS